MPTIDLSSYHQNPGTTSDGAKFNNLIDAVQAGMNALDNSNIAANAGILASKIAAPYVAFTPAWTAAGVAPVLGNGTLSGRFVQIGKLVSYTMFFQAGSTTTFGTGVWNFTLPVTASASLPASTPIGVVYSLDASASAVNFSPLVFANTTQINIQSPVTWPTGTQNIYTNLIPWTWATSDTIWATGTYEAA